MATAGFSGRRQFDVACGVLSRCVKAEAATAAAGKTVAAEAPAPTTTTAAAAAPTTMLLMPGADVTPDVTEEEPAEATPATTQLAQLTITYGDRVLVLDDFPSHRVAELVLVAEGRRRRPDDASGAGGTTTTPTADIIPAVARKASLQRFMEKRRDRLVARAPYAAALPAPASSDNERRNQLDEQDNAARSSWLGLGVPGGSAC